MDADPKTSELDMGAPRRSMERQCLRPKCDNCGAPATYRGLHWEAGSVYVCEDCRKSHGNEHQFMRQIWPPQFLPNVDVDASADEKTLMKKSNV